MSTILDVAKLAGVSKSTISRVLNQPEAVKPEVRQAVLDAMEKLNYTPSYFAQGIRTGKTKTIAMLVPDYSNVFYAEMFKGVEEVALAAGYMVLICNTDRGVDREARYIKQLVGRKIDAIIYNTYNMDRENIGYLMSLSEKVPVIFMDHVFLPGDDVSYVVTESVESTRRAVRYLHGQGRRRIGYIKIAPKVSVVESRYQGYVRGMEDCGLAVDEALVYRPDSLESQGLDHIVIGEEAGRYYAALPQPPDAVIACFDVLAMGCMRGLKRSGVRIPDDIAVVGFDNISLCELVDPALTTIGQPIKELGVTAARIAIDQLRQSDKRTQERVVFPGELIIREST